jgi:hypothetical protein
VPIILGHNNKCFQILKYAFHYNNYASIVDPWLNMKQELKKKKTNITSNSETSRYIVKRVYLIFIPFDQWNFLLAEAKSLQQNVGRSNNETSRYIKLDQNQ